MSDCIPEQERNRLEQADSFRKAQEIEAKLDLLEKDGEVQIKEAEAQLQEVIKQRQAEVGETEALDLAEKQREAKAKLSKVTIDCHTRQAQAAKELVEVWKHELTRRRKVTEAEIPQEIGQRNAAEVKSQECIRQGKENHIITEAIQKPHDLTLNVFLEQCHEMDLAVKINQNVNQDVNQNVQREEAIPKLQFCPSKVVQWHDFPIQQKRTWNHLRAYEGLESRRDYHQQLTYCSYIRGKEPICFKDDLASTLRLMLELPVRDIFDALTTYSSLKGKISFYRGESFRESDEKRNMYDGPCIRWEEAGMKRPLVVLLYKAPYELNLEQIKGLMDDSTSCFFECRTTTAITDLFSAMKRKCVNYGCLCTGEALIFAHIGNDPAVIQYHISIPRQDVTTDGMEASAVARLTAFIVQALQDESFANHRSAPTSKIQSRQYCTHKCLLGVVNGEELDASCPNVQQHGPQHLKLTEFMQRVCDQLAADDEGADSDCCPLYMHGSRGALFKINLTPYGYTFLGKASHQDDRRYLRQERHVYEHLADLQGIYIPVCCGRLILEPPYLYDGAKLEHMLILSWGGEPLFNLFEPTLYPEDLASQVESDVIEAFGAIHDREVLHGDTEPRNLLFDRASGRLMLIDFERSIIRPKWASSSNGEKDYDLAKYDVARAKLGFEKELNSMLRSLKIAVGRLRSEEREKSKKSK